MEIKSLNDQFFSAAVTADAKGNKNEKLDKSELIDFAREGVKQRIPYSQIKSVTDSFGESTDELKAFMTELRNLQELEHKLQEIKEFSTEAQERRQRDRSSELGAAMTTTVVPAVFGASAGIFVGLLAGGIATGFTGGSCGGPIGAAVGAAIGLGIGIYKSIPMFKSFKEQSENAKNIQTNTESLISTLEDTIAAKEEELGLNEN